MVTPQQQKFLEEYQTLCKKYGYYLFSDHGISIAIVGAALKNEIIDEHIEEISNVTY